MILFWLGFIASLGKTNNVSIQHYFRKVRILSRSRWQSVTCSWLLTSLVCLDTSFYCSSCTTICFAYNAYIIWLNSFKVFESFPFSMSFSIALVNKIMLWRLFLGISMYSLSWETQRNGFDLNFPLEYFNVIF